MATLVSITQAAGPEGGQTFNLVLDHYDLMNFQGLWTKQLAEAITRKAADARGYRFAVVLNYHFFYQEWIGPSGKTIRSAEMGVTVA